MSYFDEYYYEIDYEIEYEYSIYCDDEENNFGNDYDDYYYSE
jgi:hypothetical protein|tara:strand:- start:242 stop:367 length:126 start_codon:yes stop_codon:yes gene_type:complete